MVASYRSAITNRTWVIDSGASHNYCNNLRDFRKISVKETNMIVKLGDDHQAQAKKKGVVHLGGVEIEAFFVPEFRISLLSVGQLDSHGYTSTFRSGICSIVDAKGRKVLGANLEDGLYILSTDGSAQISEIRILRTAPHSHTANMWHRRLAHLNHQDLRRLLESSGERITDQDVEPVTDENDESATDLTPGLCQTCVHTKQQQLSRSCLDYSVRLDRQRRLSVFETGAPTHTSGVLTLPAYSHFRRAHTSGVLTCHSYSHALRGLSSSHTPCVGSLFSRCLLGRSFVFGSRAVFIQLTGAGKYFPLFQVKSKDVPRRSLWCW